MSQEDGSGKQVIARAAAVLFALENQPDGLSLAQIVRATNLPRSTAHRIVAALETQKLLINDANGIRLGPALSRLAKSVHKDILTVGRPFLEMLGRKTRETVDLCVYRGAHSISVDQYPSDRELRVISPVGTAFPIHCAAHGKAMLAQLSDQQIAELFKKGIEQRTKSTFKDLDTLISHIREVRVQGFALDIEEHAEGVCGIGVSLNTGLNEQYAMALAIPKVQFNKNFNLYHDAIMKCKAEIEAVMLGGTSPT